MTDLFFLSKRLRKQSEASSKNQIGRKSKADIENFARVIPILEIIFMEAMEK